MKERTLIYNISPTSSIKPLYVLIFGESFFLFHNLVKYNAEKIITNKQKRIDKMPDTKEE